jgi:hypothetical protein
VPKRKPEVAAQGNETIFDLVTRKDRIEQYAAILCDGWRLRDRGVFLHIKSSVIECPSLLEGDPRKAVEYYVSRGQDIPLWLGKLIVDAGQPKGRAKGRYTNPKVKALQLARDFASYLAVLDLMAREHMKQTPAEQKAADALGVRRQSVHNAFEREKQRIAESGIPNLPSDTASVVE